jgi:hypothetical protein
MKDMKKENLIQHIWTILCSSSSIDSQTNNVSLYNVVEEVGFQLQPTNGQQVNFSEKKGVPFNMEVVSLWKRTNQENLVADAKIELLDPSNQKMQEALYKLEFKPQHQRMRSIIKMNGITITGQGEYNFSILLKEEGSDNFKEVARTPIVIKITAPTDLGLLQK